MVVESIVDTVAEVIKVAAIGPYVIFYELNDFPLCHHCLALTLRSLACGQQVRVERFVMPS